MERLLRAAGPTLEAFESPFSWELSFTDIKYMKKCCSLLSHVSLYVDDDDDRALTAYAALLCSLGSQLKFAELEDLPTTLRQKGVTACPDMHCGYILKLHCGPPDMEMFSLLAPYVSDLALNFSVVDLSDMRFREAAHSCLSLESIDISTLHLPTEKAVHMIEQLLDVEKSQLTSFVLNCQRSSVDALRELGKRAGTLREFTFRGHLQERGAFEPVVRGAPLLKKVTIVLHCLPARQGYFDKTHEIFVEDIARSFLGCPNLRMLEIVASDFVRRVTYPHFEAVATLCRRVGLKKGNPLFVRVLDEVYLR